MSVRHRNESPKLKYLGVSITDLIDVYVKHIRIVLEYRAVVWHSSLTVEQSNTLERVQKTCFKIILGKDYAGYSAALEKVNLCTLFERRETRCLSFVKKALVFSFLSILQ